MNKTYHDYVVSYRSSVFVQVHEAGRQIDISVLMPHFRLEEARAVGKGKNIMSVVMGFN